MTSSAKEPPRTPPWYIAATGAVQLSGQRVFTRRELEILLAEQQRAGTISERVTLAKFIEALSDKGELRDCEIPSVQADPSLRAKRAGPYRPFRRYVLGEAPALEVALSLRGGSYLSHGSALQIHGMLDGNAKGLNSLPVYVNKEQSAKAATTGVLSQAAIDRAFQNRQRASQFVFLYADVDLVLLNGKQSGDLGVEDVAHHDGHHYRVTCLERTIIDSAVRPNYAGGVSRVLEAYRRARDQFSMPVLVDTLGRLRHAYPYHQSIGFYLTRAGYPETALAQLRALGLEHDFYLANQMSAPAYDSAWRIYYPTGLL
jgi:hypothetical protein